MVGTRFIGCAMKAEEITWDYSSKRRSYVGAKCEVLCAGVWRARTGGTESIPYAAASVNDIYAGLQRDYAHPKRKLLC